MPNEPMTPDKLIADIDDNYAPLSVDAKIEIDALLAKLIASTLQAAAERVCEEWCFEKYCKVAIEKTKGCVVKDAILAPLDKTDKGK